MAERWETPRRKHQDEGPWEHAKHILSSISRKSLVMYMIRSARPVKTF